ncbi:hypothetical protein BHE74_00058445 [Ensete ventricosum]|nr:hypothetical protein BHE74_00058445 [Ensete ventricosum]
MQGRPPMARSAVRGSRLRLRLPARGGRTRPKPLAGATANKCARPRAWLVPAGIGSTRSEAVRGSPVTRAVACKGGRSCRGNAHGQCRPRAVAPPLA